VRILSIQSSVAFGHAGNSAAVFPLQRLGHDVVAVHTVHFSNHTGYGATRGPLHTPAEVASVLHGIAERDVLPTIDAVLSGYLGDPEMGAVVLSAVSSVKAANPNALYCCDPVMGDVGGGFYVRPGIPEFFRDTVVPHTDVLTPNQFELEFLTGHPVPTLDSVVDAAEALRSRGPRVVLVTSVLHPDIPADHLDTVVVSDEGAWAVTTPILQVSSAGTTAGTGDLTAALFLAHLPSGPADALARTVSSVYAVLEATVASGSYEIELVAAQEAIADPPLNLPVRQLR
jgi:pyridoxine kinase